MMPIEPNHSPGRILLGMSGGVDSSVSAFILKKQGYEVIGLSLLTHDAGVAGLSDAKAICSQLGIEWLMVDVRKEFQQIVISDFIDSYLLGRTPNPCIICNPAIKFAALYREAQKMDCSHVATGHYAKIEKVTGSGRFALAKTEAGLKDQTYFMYRLSQEQLSRLIFPLSGMDKEQVRLIAAQAGLRIQDGSRIAEKPDSQDNCFIPSGDYANFIQNDPKVRNNESLLDLTRPGTVVDQNGRPIGTHRGLIHYTVGQRKGFQVKTTERLFVVGKIPSTNSLVVGPFDQVLRSEIKVIKPVYSGLAAIGPGESLEARIRNSAREVPCKVYPMADDCLKAIFEQPVAAPAPGQSCVFYRDGLIMAGGFIDDY